MASAATTSAPSDVRSRTSAGRVRYLGSKARIVDQIVDLVGDPDDGTFVDPFAGTGVVAEAAAMRGWKVRAGDLLASAVLMTQARLLSHKEVQFRALGGYELALHALNELEGERGFFSREYTLDGPADRHYFVPENGRRIDAVRRQITAWRADGLISDQEHGLLLADLIGAANRVANIAGTYGCFLGGTTTPAAMRPLELVPSTLKDEPVDFALRIGDAAGVVTTSADTLYLDPPYTKRQYAAYYHIPETIAHEDEPTVGGKTGLRPWQDRSSDYCYKRRAHDTLVELIRQSSARRVLLSYSDEGHVDLDHLAADLQACGTVVLHEISSIGRYRPNVAASSARDEVLEYVLEVTR